MKDKRDDCPSYNEFGGLCFDCLRLLQDEMQVIFSAKTLALEVFLYPVVVEQGVVYVKQKHHIGRCHRTPLQAWGCASLDHLR